VEPRIVGNPEGSGGPADVFDTGDLRRRVLEAWAASPARFREDANAEEELALGGYRDRLVVELAQNAADAALRAGREEQGRLRLTLRDGVLVAANTGAPLDRAGVESLSTLRASAKRPDAPSGPSAGPGTVGGGSVGRFGVGFAAVLAVADEPAVLSTTGGVRWSLAEAREAAHAVGDRGLADEIRRRDGHVPLLRLPMPAEGAPPAGYDTAVVLPLRDAAAEDLARRLLAEIDDALLLTLRGLCEVVVDDGAGVRTLRREVAERRGGQDGPAVVVISDTREGADVGGGEGAAERVLTRWQVVSDGGRLDEALLAGRPVEERARPWWSVTWAVPVDAEGGPVPPRTPAVVHAPTPSDEPLGVPALLIASLPLDSTRRHVARGPLTDFLLGRAAEAYARLLRLRGPDARSLELVPGPLGRGELDGALRRELLARLVDVPFLPTVSAAAEKHDADLDLDPDGLPATEGGPVALRPREAVLLEGASTEVLAAVSGVLPGLLPAGLERRTELRTLGVRRVPLAEVVDQLGGLEREPAWWRELYAALAGTDPEPLGALPVPLADGRTVTGPRRVLVPAPEAGWDGDPAEDLARLGLRLVHPDAAHPLLEKLGAGAATPEGVLRTAELRAAVERSAALAEEDPDEAEDLADAVLRVVKAAAAGSAAVFEDGGRRGEDGGAGGGLVAEHPWLARLALFDEDGEPAAAGELVLPGSPLADLVFEDDAAFVAAEWVERWGPEVLAAVGVATAPVLVRAADVVLDPDDLDRLDPTAEPDRAAGGEPTGLIDEAPDGLAEWAEDTLDLLAARREQEASDAGRQEADGELFEVPPVAAELLAVRDLDLIDDDAWPEALALLAAPPLREAVTEPVRLLLPDGGSAEVRPYTAWWLRDHPVLDGRRPAGLRAAGADPLLRGLYDEARTGLDAAFLHALGVRTTLAALLAEPGGPDEVLDRMADPDRPVGHRQLHGLYSALARVPLERMEVPDEVRALPPMPEGSRRRPEWTVVVDAEDAVIADAPDLMQLLDGLPVVPVAPALAAELAERLRVPLASEVAGGRVLTQGVVHRVPEAVRELLPGCPEVYEEHEELLVVGPEGEEAAVDWRWDPEGALSGSPDAEGDREEAEPDEFAVPAAGGALHAATPEGLAAGLAWAAGLWTRRFEALAVLGDPERAYELSAARDFEG